MRMYFDPVYIAVTRWIGYSGLSLKDAQAQADDIVKAVSEKLPHADTKELRHRVQNAVYELTSVDKRLQENARLELTGEARKMAGQLLGASPEHPEAEFFEAQRKRWREQIEQENGQVQPKKRARKGRGK